MQRETRCSDFFLLDVNGKTNHPLSHRLAPIKTTAPSTAITITNTEGAANPEAASQGLLP